MIQTLNASIRFNSAFLFMLVAAFMRSLSDLTLKSSLTELSSWDAFFWPRLSIFFAAVVVVLVFHQKQKRIITEIQNICWNIKLIIAFAEIVALGGLLLITLAYWYGPLTLVSALGSSQPLFVLVFVIIVNLIRPGTIPNKAGRKTNTVRLLSIFLIILGIYLLGEG